LRFPEPRLILFSFGLHPLVNTTVDTAQKMAELEAEITTLRARVRSLEEGSGIAAEQWVAELIGGTLTTGSAFHDITTPNGTRFEVKFSRLNIPMKTSNSRRWSWGHPLGYAGAKRFERLILVAEVDPRFRDLYREPLAPYVLFDIPFDAVLSVMRKDHLIQITTSPRRTFGEAAKTANTLFQQFHLTSDELRRRYKA
jgi:hypothetical protein